MPTIILTLSQKDYCFLIAATYDTGKTITDTILEFLNHQQPKNGVTAICLDQTYGALAADIAAALAQHSDKLRTFHPMTPERFCTWLEEQSICRFFDKNQHPGNISPFQAKILLASDAIRRITENL